MSTLIRENKPSRGLLRSNPVLSRLSKITERSQDNAATYAGIARKTSFFLLMTLVGLVAQLVVMNAMGNEPVWQEITINSFLVFKVLNGYEYLGMEALLLTVAVVFVMSWLYSSGIVKADSKFRTVLLSLMLGSLAFGLLTFIGSLIPATRPFVQTMMNNSFLVIAMDVIGLVIAALFLISDFSTIDSCVKEGYPREYEWAGAFGLVFTVIWIYLKILDLLMELNGKNSKD